MGYIRGESREQMSLLPEPLTITSVKRIRRISGCICGKAGTIGMGFERTIPAETGRPAYDPGICCAYICTVI